MGTEKKLEHLNQLNGSTQLKSLKPLHPLKRMFTSITSIAAFVLGLSVLTLVTGAPTRASAASTRDFTVTVEDAEAESPYALAWGYNGIPFDQSFFRATDEERYAVEDVYGLPVPLYLIHKNSQTVLSHVVPVPNPNAAEYVLVSYPQASLISIHLETSWFRKILSLYVLSADGLKVVSDVKSAWHDMENELKRSFERDARYKEIVSATGAPDATLGKKISEGKFAFTFSASARNSDAALQGEGQLQIIANGSQRTFKLVTFRVTEATK